ncbi:Uncharacterised protein [Salmonella enterica subsp. enterica serovar Bovismorbificans]|uniref:Uncharacterized protein n=1 Tax=Salmonella enterica subsp. enterica serovar Bovismorbificans TaxID=58097 RepID=A0A655CTW7_SALET|nr:Uncharacterised protein [Salmonella enterica subsp. enterica serovar Bovismorbificans]CNU93249.1 Uncharacterised protein [Salmonella enterica subsp. enterica serovar Bovismorbificans]
MSDAQQHIQRTQRLPDVEGADNDAKPKQAHHREQTNSLAPRRDQPHCAANQQQNKRADRALGKDRKKDQR